MCPGFSHRNSFRPPARRRRWRWRAWVLLAALPLWFVSLAPAQTAAPIHPAAPPLPPPGSPVDFFRELLAMQPAERERALSNRPPAVRARVLAKVREYETLSPEERELRLRATELRWYLTPLMRQPPDRRPPLEQTVPAHLRQAVADRLALWDRLPESVRTQFLRDELALNYFSRVPPLPHSPDHRALRVVAVRTSSPAGPGVDTPPPLPQTEMRDVVRQLRRFFEWTPEERQKALSTLSDTERRQIEQSLRRFEQLTREQRRQVLASFERLARMSPEERRAFLRNAERWTAMTPSERERWRRLVQQVPELPPLPPGFYDPVPPPLPPGAPASSQGQTSNPPVHPPAP